MFITRKSFLFSCLCASTLLAGCQLFPMQRDEDDQLYDGYGMNLAKKDHPMSLKNSFLNALLMSDRMNGPGSPSQRKKAVDSTFIRFGRSSSQGLGPSPTIFDEDSVNSTPDDTSKSLYHGLDYGSDRKMIANQLLKKSIDEGCLIRSKNDMYMVLMGKTCIKNSPKVKRENVNDTFVRFGKRDVQSSFARDQGSDRDIKYGR